MRRLALALCVLVAVCGAAAFAAVPAGDEIPVNATTAGQQDDAKVTIDPDGAGFTVTWQSDEDGADTPNDVMIRRFGSQAFGETRINFDAAGDQDDPVIASQDNGDGVVAFHSDYLDDLDEPQQDIKARLFRSGAPFGSSDINVDITPNVDDENPAAAMDPDGDFVVAWQSGGNAQISARLFNENGGPVTDEFIVADDAAGQIRPEVAMDDAGNFVVAWEGAQEGLDADGIYARLFDATGAPLTSPSQVNTTVTGAQQRATVAMDADGDFVVGWEGPAPNAAGGVFFQRFDETGAPQGGETPVATFSDEGGMASVALDADGDFAFAWGGDAPEDSQAVLTRDYTAAGVPVADAIVANQTLPDQQQGPWVASDSDGDYVVAWETNFATAGTEDAFARRFARGTAGPGPGGGGGGGGNQLPPVLDNLGLPVLTDADVGVKSNVAPLSGTVLLGLQPGVTAARHTGRAAQKGITFVPLTEARQIPIGSFLDTRRGTVRVRTATGTQNGTQTGDFGRGLFQLLQPSRPSARGLTELALKGGSFARSRCRVRRGSSSAGAAQLSRRTIRRLRSNATGRFRTRGRNSSATVRGTIWETTDRCDGTLTKVTRGTVVVRDFRRRKNIVVRAGKRTKGPGGGRGSYLARAH